MSLQTKDVEALTITNNKTHKALVAEGVATLFRKVAVYSRGKRAVICGKKSLTYAELNQQSERLAYRLAKYRGQRIGLLIERSEQAIIAILAILKAGAVYVPLDPAFPDEHLHYILQDAAVAALVTSRQHSGRQSLCPEIILEAALAMTQSVRTELPAPDPDRAAYVMYTSGSTGIPKGVEIMQAGIRRLVCHNDPIPILPGDSVAQAGNLAFDASTWEIWGALLNGATLVILPYETVIDSRALSRTLHSLRITHAWLTVALFNQLAAENPGAFGSLRHLLVGGDALNPTTIAAVMRSETPPENIWNGYGPTENTTFTTLHYISLGDCERSSIPIGRPVVNTCCYVLDKQMQPVAVGEIGELYTSGEGLAQGYLNQPEKTAEVFIANPFYEHDAVRTQTPATPVMYKTGDLVRWLEDGTLEFLGRADQQVKIRGYRVEPGEVEHQLLQLPGISQAVVMATERHGEKQLAAWCVAETSARAILASLRTRVPAQMVPSSLDVLKALPLTINGKVDKRRLPPPQFSGAFTQTHTEFKTETERQLAVIWRDLLGGACQPHRSTHFFEAGGHSLLVVKLQHGVAKKLRKQVEIKTLFSSPVLKDQAKALDALPAQSEKAGLPAPRLDEVDYPLSEAQRRLWIIEQQQPNSSLYHVCAAFRFGGRLNIEAFTLALRDIQHRHYALRIGIKTVQGEPRQILSSQSIAPRIKTTASDAWLNTVIQHEADAPFTFDGTLLWRVTLFRITGRHAAVLFNFHHIITDGWSMGIFFRELDALYRKHTLQPHALLAPVLYHHTDYCLWEEEQDYTEALSWWHTRLDDVVPFRLSGSEDSRYSEYESDEQRILLSREESERVSALARTHRSGLLNILKCALALLISRYTAQADITFCSIWANRHFSELDNAIGMFANTLLLRTHVDEQLSVAQFLTQNATLTLDDLEHGGVPFSAVLEGLPRSGEGIKNSALCSVMLVLQNTEGGDGKIATLSQLDLKPVEMRPELAKFDLTISVVETAEGRLRIAFNYRKRHFTPALISRLLDGVQRILAAFSHEQEPLNRIEITSDEQRQAVAAFSAMPKLTGSELSLINYWRKQVTLSPNAAAVRFKGETLTYAELDSRSEALAHHLMPLRRKRIALMLDRGELAIVTMLAILKAGATYVPIDPAYPDSRLQTILQDSAAALLVTSRQYTDRQVCCPELIPDDLPFSSSQGALPPLMPDPHQPAYVMYTSGSTGEPKGVEVLQAGVRRLVCHNDPVPILPGDCVAQGGNLAFDASTWEIWGALLNGATLVIFPFETIIDSQALARALLDQRITHAWFTVALFNQLALESPDAFGGLRHLLIGGDALNPGIVAKVMRSSTPPENIWNGYGPTENTTFTTLHYISAKDCERSSIPIGRPIANTCCYVLDGALRPQPVGAVGELYTSGEGLARGYLNKPDKTAEVFIPNPFYTADTLRRPSPASKVMYKTGDLARWREDGTLEFIGRADRQVKIRGYRIEPGEVENQLLAIPEVSRAIVMVTTHNEEKQLAAWCVANATRREIVKALRTRLPAHMIPSSLMVLEQLPLTANGKVDRRRLPSPERLIPVADNEPLQTETERQLAEIWCSLLDLQQLPDRSASFFELGGHSLLAIAMVTRIAQTFRKEIGVADVFKYTTLCALAQFIEGNETGLNTTPLLMAQDIAAVQANQYVPAKGNDAIEHILLTGATGFLGIYLLSMLQRYAPEATVHCLIRARDEAQARQKLMATADMYRLRLNLNTIVILRGDLNAPHLGLSQEQLKIMASRIDTIYHCGAWVNHLHTYETLRQSNVISTQTLLALCSRGRHKRFHYISTLSAAWQEAGVIAEETTAPTCPATHGYTQSKWVCERMVANAFAHGLHGKIYRMGNITGDTETGISNAEVNHTLNLIKGCLQAGAAPAWHGSLDLSPVNTLAELLINDSIFKGHRDAMVNLGYLSAIPWIELFNFLKQQGHRLDILPPAEWISRCVKPLDRHNALYPFKSFYERYEEENIDEVKRHLVLTTLQPLDPAKLLARYYRYWTESRFIALPDGEHQAPPR